MKQLWFSAICFAMLMSMTSVVHAACTTPTGVAGDQFYNTTYNVMQYCNDTNWVNMGSPGTSSPPTCTTYSLVGSYGTCAARMDLYQTGVLQWDGTTWSCRTVYTVGSNGLYNDC